MSTPAPGWAEDPSAPYFEALYAAARILAPDATREDLLAALREADPNDTLRIREPYCSVCANDDNDHDYDHGHDPMCPCSCHRLRRRVPEVAG